MMGRVSVLIAGVTIALSGAGQRALAIAACPDATNCVQVQVDVGSTTTVKPGDTFNANLTFKQGPDNGQPGGIDEIAALALTLNIGTTSGTPLTLASCTLDGAGFPVGRRGPRPIDLKFQRRGRERQLRQWEDALPVSRRRADARQLHQPGHLRTEPVTDPGNERHRHPDAPGGTADAGDVQAEGGDAAPQVATVPLHIINQVDDTSRPQFTAFLSVGDKLAVDQTCVPVTGQPPCSAADSVSQVAITNATVTVMGSLHRRLQRRR